MPYLLTLSIGPVQDFIATARRSRDLWFGSWLLSELSKTAAKTIVELQGKDLGCLIFPKVSTTNALEENSEFSVVNKIVAVVDQPKEIGEAVYTAMRERLEDIRTEAYGRISKKWFRGELQEKATAQVRDLIEFFWTSVKVENPDNDDEYQKMRKELAYLFAARKSTRQFASPRAWSGNLPKSSLDGQRESVIHEGIYDDVREGKITKEQLRSKLGIREGERLCGVGLLKRLGNARDKNNNRIDSFASTSHVASIPLIEFLERDEEKNKAALAEYVIELSRLLRHTIEESELYKVLGKTTKTHSIFRNYDGHILFQERLKEFFTERNDLESARQALKEFFKQVGVRQSALLPYYGLLLADGDAMGKAIDARKSRTDHQHLSAELSEFARGVKGVVETEYRGSLIYSGGDDVLALLPLHTILECAKALSVAFAKKLARFEITENNNTYSPTLTVGIAVMHHLEPLEDALELARKAETAAKSLEGKNALAVIVDKRSGASRMLKGTWGTVDARLNQFVEWHKGEEIPDAAAYQLRDLANRLEASGSLSDKGTLARIQLVEAKRILKRKRASQGQKVIDKEKLNEFGQHLKAISVRELADELIVAKIFADAKNLAEGKNLDGKRNLDN
jgi:CRISPR-associated protein Cmr2